jgi:hypothetical protein
MDGDDDVDPDDTLSPSESLDSDEVRNADGDTVVDPPERWIEAREDQCLADKLAAEEPDTWPRGGAESARPTRRHRGQVDGAPEDGESFFEVVDDDQT